VGKDTVSDGEDVSDGEALEAVTVPRRFPVAQIQFCGHTVRLPVGQEGWVESRWQRGEEARDLRE
jgi:hypothetical protein